MSKPSELPEWASSLSADITDPMLAKKQQGWVVEQPPHDVFNWWQNLVFQWTQWLNAFESTAHTWTALQTLSLGLAVTGGVTVDSLHITGNLTLDGTVAGFSPTACTLGGGVSVGSGYVPPQVWKDVNGAVHFEFTGFHAAGNTWTLCTLPVGFRPPGSQGREFPAWGRSLAGGGNTVCAIVVLQDGTVNVQAQGATTVDGVSGSVVFHPSATVQP